MGFNIPNPLNGLKNVAGSVVNAVTETADKVVDNAVDTAHKVADNAGALVNDVSNGITGMVDQAWQQTADFADEGLEFVHEAQQAGWSATVDKTIGLSNQGYQQLADQFKDVPVLGGATAGLQAVAGAANGVTAHVAKGGLSADFDKLQSGWDEGVKGLENWTAGNIDKQVDKVKDIPVLGGVAQAAGAYAKFQSQLLPGAVGALGDLVLGIGGIAAHPVSTLEGFYKMAENAPIALIPGFANPLKLAHEEWDVAVNGKSQKEALNSVFNPVQAGKEGLGFYKDLLGGVVKPYKEAFEEGRYGDLVGRAAIDVITTIGTGGESAAVKAGVEGAEVAGDAGRAAKGAKAAGEAGEAGRAGKAGEVGEAGKAAEVRQYGNLKVELPEQAELKYPNPADWAKQQQFQFDKFSQHLANDPQLRQAFDHWDKLSDADKLDVAQAVSDKLGSVYGFQAAPVKQVSFADGRAGQFNFGPVEISPTVFSDPKQFLDVVVHEQVHAYQWDLVSRVEKLPGDPYATLTGHPPIKPGDPYYEAANNFKHGYQNQVDPNVNYQGYRANAIESHAWAAGEQIVKDFFAKPQSVAQSILQYLK